MGGAGRDREVELWAGKSERRKEARTGATTEAPKGMTRRVQRAP